MRCKKLLVLGALSSQLVMPVNADEMGDRAFGDAPGGTERAAHEKGPSEGIKDAAGGAESGSSGTGPGKTEFADTPTAVGHIYDEVEKGNIKIEGSTDPGPPP